MADVKWTIEGREFTNCNCDYGCPCQFNARPTKGNCTAVIGIQIDKGHHATTLLDGLRLAGVFVWPGAIHEGRGEGFLVVDERASEPQRTALLRIAGGKDTEPGTTFFHVFSSMLETVHKPGFARIELEIDVEARRARIAVPGLIEARGEPVLNPVTGAKHRARIDMPQGFEYALAEIGRGWSKTQGPIKVELADCHGHFARLHLNQNGVVR
jgi:hypothetical protein